MSPEFTPVQSLLGGALLGLSASTMLLVQGRIAGISGIVGGLLHPGQGDQGWRIAFVAGLLIAGGAGILLAPQLVSSQGTPALPLVALAGLLVGFGTRLGNGCTSGHGVCGLARGSRRSLASVLVFMATGMVVATLGGLLRGGAA